jgi:hypothetical protein
MKHLLALPFVLAACSGGVHHGVDAQPADGSPDTVGPSTGDPPANAVKLVVTHGGMPHTGVAVVFQNPDSSLVQAGLTNEKGLAWAVMPEGGFVTAIAEPGSGLDELTTFAAVEPGDALVLDSAPTGDTGQWPVKLAVPADIASAAGYQVYSTCGGPFGVAPNAPSDELLVGCNGMADFVVIASDDSDTPLRGFLATSVAVPDPPPPPATDAMDPIYPNLAIPGAFSSVVTSTFSYTNLPSYVTWVATYHAFAGAHGRVFERTAGAAPSGTTAATQIVLPDASAPTLVETTLFGDQFGQQLIYEARAAAATPYSLDVGNALLPAYASTPAYDPDRRVVSWSEGSGAQTPNVVRARIHAYRDAIPEGRAWGWRIIAPRTATTITYPQLPVFGFDFNVQASDIVGVDELTTAQVPGGYAAVRRDGFGDLSSVLLGTTGSLIVQTLADMML